MPKSHENVDDLPLGPCYPPEIAAERASVVAHKLLTTPPRLRTIGKRHVADAKPERPEQAAEGS